MYSLTIHFGPNAVTWAFLFKEKKTAETVAKTLMNRDTTSHVFDDFGQNAVFEKGTIHAHLLEDLDLVEEARILRSLANARGEAKARQRAATDPLIRAGMVQQGPSVLQPRFNG